MSVGVRGGGGRGYLCCFLKFSAHAQLKNSNINNNYNNNCNLSMSLQQKKQLWITFDKMPTVNAPSLLQPPPAESPTISIRFKLQKQQKKNVKNK